MTWSKHELDCLGGLGGHLQHQVLLQGEPPDPWPRLPPSPGSDGVRRVVERYSGVQKQVGHLCNMCCDYLHLLGLSVPGN